MKRCLFRIGLTVAALVLAVPMLGISTNPLIKVTTCRPSLNVSTSYWYGWTPGYYPPYPPYRWYTPYNTWYYEPPITTTNPELGIDYTNMTQKTMKIVEFGLVANGNLIAEVRDVGKFSPGVEIKHRFGINENVFPIGTAMAQCLPLRITYEDGTVWTSRHLPRLKQQLQE